MGDPRRVPPVDGPLVRSSDHAREQARPIDPDGPGRITEIMEADIEGGAHIDEAEALLRSTVVAPPKPRLVQLGSL